MSKVTANGKSDDDCLFLEQVLDKLYDFDVAQKDHQVEVVTFQDPRKKMKTKHTPTPDKIKARLEVHRFGITGYHKEQQRVFEQDRAIMLGARPPKKQYVNYKILQQQIKEKRLKDKEEVDPVRPMELTLDKKKPSTSGSGSGPSGQVGRFKNGMLILSSKEIQKIKGTKGRR
uniref:Uncharacterized protein n=1 Tax=Periophthalmus magnuspinnatus TaxID=409849 RepID=A0A3B3ZJ79_9GOBI